MAVPAAMGALAAVVAAVPEATAIVFTGSEPSARTPIFQDAIFGIGIRERWGAVDREARLRMIPPKVSRPREAPTESRGLLDRSSTDHI